MSSFLLCYSHTVEHFEDFSSVSIKANRTLLDTYLNSNVLFFTLKKLRAKKVHVAENLMNYHLIIMQFHENSILFILSKGLKNHTTFATVFAPSPPPLLNNVKEMH